MQVGSSLTFDAGCVLSIKTASNDAVECSTDQGGGRRRGRALGTAANNESLAHRIPKGWITVNSPLWMQLKI